MNNFLDRWFSKREIRDCDGSTYMHRWFVIRNELFAMYIHKFVRSDFERALHDHPWSFIVIPIWRGYIEHSEGRCGYCRDYTSECTCGEWGVPGNKGTVTQTRRRVYPLLGIRFRRAEFRHRVELFTKRKYYVGWEDNYPASKFVDVPLPSWSIFIRFRKRRKWGFWLPTGWEEAVAWWKTHCEDTPEMEGTGKPGEVISKS